MMAVPAVDFQLHNSVFLVAHFHNAIIGGVVFGYFAGLVYWFPKIFGFKLNETLGKWAAILWFLGFFVAFTPLYILGLKGMTRRLYHYPAGTGWHDYLIVAAIGASIVGLAVLIQIIQVVISIKNRNEPGYKVTSGDPWGHGRSLEWSIPCPAPFYNFAVTPEVHSRDAYWEYKQRIAAGEAVPTPQYSRIHMPRNTGVGFMIGVFAFIFGFSMVWHIHWLSILGLLGIIVTGVARTYNKNIDYYVEVAEVEKIESAAVSGGQ